MPSRRAGAVRANAAAQARARPHTSPARQARRGAGVPPPARLERYLDGDGHPRELCALAGAAGSVLVVDRDALTLCDRRLVAHLGAEEPPQNAALVARLYVKDRGRRRCRQLTAEDLTSPPPHEHKQEQDAPVPACPSLLRAASAEPPPGGEAVKTAAQPLCHEGWLYRLAQVPRPGRRAELRWTAATSAPGPWRAVSVRDVVERMESYEPASAMTASALAAFAGRSCLSLATLRGELRRLNTSEIVLNRGLREAVLQAIQERGLSLSEIAIRCGRAKRDKDGRLSGQTSWVTRRVGLAPEEAGRPPTRWVHCDVLALIAREGLELSPREVELG